MSLKTLSPTDTRHNTQRQARKWEDPVVVKESPPLKIMSTAEWPACSTRYCIWENDEHYEWSCSLDIRVTQRTTSIVSCTLFFQDWNNGSYRSSLCHPEQHPGPVPSWTDQWTTDILPKMLTLHYTGEHSMIVLRVSITGSSTPAQHRAQSTNSSPCRRTSWNCGRM